MFFYNSAGYLTHGALAGLQAIGAPKIVVVFEVNIKLSPAETAFEDNQVRNKIRYSFISEALQQLLTLSDIFTSYSGPLNELLKSYVHHNVAFLKGLRTRLQQWRLMHACRCKYSIPRRHAYHQFLARG